MRDVGSFRAFTDVSLRKAINAGWVVGPRMHCAGGYVTCTGGGGEVTGFTPDVHVPDAMRLGVADSVDEVRKAVRRLMAGGADFIKVIATGAVLAPGPTPVPGVFRGRDRLRSMRLRYTGPTACVPVRWWWVTRFYVYGNSGKLEALTIK